MTCQWSPLVWWKEGGRGWQCEGGCWVTTHLFTWLRTSWEWTSLGTFERHCVKRAHCWLKVDVVSVGVDLWLWMWHLHYMLSVSITKVSNEICWKHHYNGVLFLMRNMNFSNRHHCDTWSVLVSHLDPVPITAWLRIRVMRRLAPCTAVRRSRCVVDLFI